MQQSGEMVSEGDQESKQRKWKQNTVLKQHLNYEFPGILKTEKIGI